MKHELSDRDKEVLESLAFMASFLWASVLGHRDASIRVNPEVACSAVIAESLKIAFTTEDLDEKTAIIDYCEERFSYHVAKGFSEADKLQGSNN